MKWLIHPNLPNIIVTGGSRIDHIKIKQQGRDSLKSCLPYKTNVSVYSKCI